MYLKRLDIQGFKSFANKTVLEFGPGVTCVVGPNGTGKTNVADSLRWVLGEHASRQIRARKTEDVIFAGSDKRAPLGVAEVSIALDNSGHWLPVDFDEVVVSRRAYRNGENEYLINHARVRLRDVVELFQRAQVGQNSYAFMGQGMVEQALSLVSVEAALAGVHGAAFKQRRSTDPVDGSRRMRRPPAHASIGATSPRTKEARCRVFRTSRWKSSARATRSCANWSCSSSTPRDHSLLRRNCPESRGAFALAPAKSTALLLGPAHEAQERGAHILWER